MRSPLHIYARSLAVYRSQARALLLPGAAIFLVAGIPLGSLSEAEGAAAADLTLALFSALLGIATVLLYSGYVDEVAEHATQRPGHVAILPTIRRTLPVVWPLALAVLAYITAITLGLLAFVVPGLIFAARFCLVTPIVSLERQKPLAAMKRSWNLTRGHFWLVTGAVVAPLALEGVASVLAGLAGAELTANEALGNAIGDAVASTIVAPIVGLTMAHTYIALREPEGTAS